ncbi:glycosyltransferase, partial [Escherichia coli]
VTHNGEQWLPRTLVALARLDAQPGRLIAVDAGSTDGSRELLDKGLADGLVHQVLTGAADEGFGANVQQAVAAASDGDFHPRFLWLLHDDSA